LQGEELSQFEQPFADCFIGYARPERFDRDTGICLNRWQLRRLSFFSAIDVDYQHKPE
jgi:hypothetical protein